jgi:hypothetical protein
MRYGYKHNILKTNHHKIFITVAFVLLVVNCDINKQISSEKPETDNLKILFIGNSLTHWNNMVTMFQELIFQSEKNAYVVEFAPGGMHLDEHALNTMTHSYIQETDWDYVIIQGADYSIAFKDLRDNVLPPIRSLINLIKSNSNDTQIIFYLDYSLRKGFFRGDTLYTFNEFQSMINVGTKIVADELQMKIAPVGEAWRRVSNDGPPIDLYALDQGHPSAYGSYIMACVYFSTIYRESTTSLEYYGQLIENAAQVIQAIATETVLGQLPYWNL